MSLAYMAHNRLAPPKLLQNPTSTIAAKNVTLLVSWGNKEINQRAESLLSETDRGITGAIHPSSEKCNDWEVSYPFRNPSKIHWRKFSLLVKLFYAFNGNIDTIDGALKRHWKPPSKACVRKLPKELFNIHRRHKYWQPHKDCPRWYNSALWGHFPPV